MNSQGHFYIVAAPSGAGKTSLVRALIERVAKLKISISYTTRPPRPGDVDGVHYNFVDDATFDAMIEQKKFLEYANVFDHRYGTSHEWVMAQLEKGVDVILEIDWQGARQILQKFPTAVSIFIIPPSIKALELRLHTRGQDDEDVIQGRMAAAVSEISHHYEFEYLIVNDHFDVAINELEHIVLSHRLKAQVQQQKLAPLLAELTETQ